MFKLFSISILSICLLLSMNLVSVFAKESSKAETQDVKFDLKKWLEAEQLCLTFLEEEEILPNQLEEAKRCYINAKNQSFLKDEQGNRLDDKEVVRREGLLQDFLIERILTLDYPPEVFTELLKVTIGNANLTNLIKFLVKRGASTKDINIMHVSQGNIVICDSRDFIIEQNKDLYTPENMSKKDALSDLMYLVDTTTGHYAICPKSVEIIINQYPDLLNGKGDYPTPFHLLFRDIRSAGGVPVELILKLMTEQNIYMIDEDGNTALHYFLINTAMFINYEFINEYRAVFDKFVSLGGSLNTTNDNGQTISGLLNVYKECRDKVYPEYSRCIDEGFLRNKTR